MLVHISSANRFVHTCFTSPKLILLRMLGAANWTGSNILRDEDCGAGSNARPASGFRFFLFYLPFAVKMQNVLSYLLNHGSLVTTIRYWFSLQNRPFIQIGLQTVSRIIRDSIHRARNAITSTRHSF